MSPWILRLLRCYATIIAVIVFLGPVDAVTDLVHDTLMRLLDDSFSTTLLQKDTVAKLYQQLSRKEKALLPSQNDLTALMGAVKEEALLEFQPKVSALLSELSVQNHQTSSLLKKRMPPISPAIIKEGLSRVASEGHSLSETLRSATGAVDGFVGHAAHGVHPHHPSNPHPHHPSAPREPHAHAHAHAPEAGDVPVMATGETIILDPSIEHNVPEPPQNIFPEDSKQSVPAAATAQNENGEALNQPPNPTLPESPKSNKQKIPKSKERESEASAKPRDPFWKNWPRKYRQFQALLKKFQDKMAEAWTKMFAEDAFLGKLNARFRKIDLVRIFI